MLYTGTQPNLANTSAADKTVQLACQCGYNIISMVHRSNECAISKRTRIELTSMRLFQHINEGDRACLDVN
jgi:hypothetical protein